ncbi:MAG: glycosyltransferase [Deltaproteobacteria bacterium]|nr:glycosyltransferase [Deltaproteobacteria bacterium]
MAECARNLLFHVLTRRAAEARRPALCSLDELGAAIEAELSAGRTPASLRDYLGPEPPGANRFTVSFDDAHPSVLELAMPILRRLGVGATVFVPSTYPGETDWVMDWQALRALARTPGWCIGSHGERHLRASWRLYDEDEAGQLARLARDASRSRATLEARLDVPVELFAYPFGEAPSAARAAALQAGYRAAFTVSLDADWDGSRMAIPRQEPGAPALDDGALPGISVVVPACERVALLGEVVRRLAAQSYPEDRHEVIVVDDGSVADLARALAPQLSERVRLLRLPGSDRTFRAGQARQAGADAAAHEIVAFVDADVAVDRDYLWHLAWCHRAYPRAVVLGYLSGYNLHDLGWTHSLEQIAEADRLCGDALPVIPDRSREQALAACLDNLAGLDEPWQLAYTGNLSLPADLLAEAGGFADGFAGWGFEDVDLGVRLQRAGATWVFSRWALGYHMADAEQADARPSNPFRDPAPSPERFAPVLANLDTLAGRHPDDGAIWAFCERLRADVAEIGSPPETIGVECGAPYPFDWPFVRLHARHPGGRSFEAICDRLAYARKLGARGLYLLGGDVLMRGDIEPILAQAAQCGAERITAESTAAPLAASGTARRLRRAGLTGVEVELLAGGDFPRPVRLGRRARVTEPGLDDVAAGVALGREAGLALGAKLVLGEPSEAALERGLARVEALQIELHSAVLCVEEVRRADAEALVARLRSYPGVALYDRRGERL